jgi:hypothetical protein
MKNREPQEVISFPHIFYMVSAASLFFTE